MCVCVCVCVCVHVYMYIYHNFIYTYTCIYIWACRTRREYWKPFCSGVLRPFAPADSAGDTASRVSAPDHGGGQSIELKLNLKWDDLAIFASVNPHGF